MREKLHQGLCNLVCMATLFLTGIISAQTSPTDIYKLVENVAEIGTGYYVISSYNTSNDTHYAMTTENVGNSFISSEIGVELNQVLTLSPSIVWYIERSGDLITIKQPLTNFYVGYIGQTGNNANYIGNANSNQVKWGFIQQAGSEIDYYLQNQAQTNRHLSFNPNSGRFAAFGNTGQNPIRFYKFDEAALPNTLITLSTTNIADLGYTQGTTPVIRSFDYGVYNFEGDQLTIAPTLLDGSIELSTDELTWSTSLVFDEVYTATGTVFIRISPTAPIGTYERTLAFAISDETELIALSGTIAVSPAFTYESLTITAVDCTSEIAEIQLTGLPVNEDFSCIINGAEIALTSDANGTAAAALAAGETQFNVSSITRSLNNYVLTVDQNFTVDYDVLYTYYVDADGDGYGDDSLPTVESCTQPAGYALLAGDCDDTSAMVNPGRDEILYNGIDDNCDGNLDEGHQVTTRVISAQCGTTLSAVTTTIHVNSNTRATAYRFKVYNMATQEENIIERTSNYFGLADLPMGGTYGTTYRVSAELQYYGIWLGYYGEECYVSTPPHISDEQGSTTTCDTQLESITSIVHTYAGTDVEYYRFKFTHYDENNEEVVEIVDRERPWINFSTLATAKYGTTYSVEVATKLRSSANYSVYAAPCIIVSPDVPAIETCGVQASTSNSTFLVQTAAQVRNWRFELTNMETFETMTIVRPVRYIRFVDMPNYQPGAEYAIRVSVMTNGNWSPYGPACSIWAPMAAARQDIAATQFEVAAYPNTFDNEFRLKVSLPTHDRVEVRLYDMLGKELDVRNLEAADVEFAYFGKNIPAGVYNVVITQGKEVKTLRVIRK